MWSTSGDIFGLHAVQDRGATGNWWVGGRDAAKSFVMHRTLPNAKSAKVEETWARGTQSLGPQLSGGNEASLFSKSCNH